MQDNIKFSRELCTKYNPIVTAPATTKLNTEWRKRKTDEIRKETSNANRLNGSLWMIFRKFWSQNELPKKNFAPKRWTHSGNQKLVGIHANPIIIVWMYTLLSIGPPQNSSTSVLYMINTEIYLLYTTTSRKLFYPFWFSSSTTDDTSQIDADVPAFRLSNSSKR